MRYSAAGIFSEASELGLQGGCWLFGGPGLFAALWGGYSLLGDYRLFAWGVISLGGAILMQGGAQEPGGLKGGRLTN